MPVPLIDSAVSSSNDTEKTAVSHYGAKDEYDQRPLPHRRSSIVAEAIDPESLDLQRLSRAESLTSIQEPPIAEEAKEGASLGPPPVTYSPFALEVLVSLMGTSVFGVLARLGLLGLSTYDGRDIFPLAWVQAAGCLIMGFFLGLKDQVGAL